MDTNNQICAIKNFENLIGKSKAVKYIRDEPKNLYNQKD